MARNAEKAQSMLFRFRAQQASDLGILDTNRTRRPKAISAQTTIPICERWRGQVLKEISRKVSRIQEPALSDYQIRDLNDELNRLFKEKWQWEMRIRELGGPNYMRGGDGGGKGYRYFGRARELPGVKEMFEVKEREGMEGGEGKRGADVRAEMGRRVDAGYYGYEVEEEERVMVEWEVEKEKEAWDALVVEENEVAEEPFEALPGDVGDGVRWRLPTAEEVEAELLERRKRKLLERL